MTDIRYPYQGGVTSTDGQGLVIDPITGQLTLVLDGTSLSKSSSGLKWNDASTQFIDVSSSTTAFRVTQRGTGAALLVEDSTNPDSSPFIIHGDGRVGIGNATPDAKLSIFQDAQSSSYDLAQVKIQGATNTDNMLCLGYDTVNNVGTIQAVTRNLTTRPLLLNSLGGNVGIGTSNPLSKLVVQEPTGGGWSGRIVAGGTTNVFLVGEFNSNAWLGAHNAGLTAWAPFYINPDGPETLYLGAINTSRSNGTIITVANNPLDYNVGIKTNSSTPSLLITQQGTGHCLVVEDSTNPDSTPFVIDSNGNVGIGTTSPTNRLTVQISSVGDGFSVRGNTTGGISPQFSLMDNTTQKGAFGLALKGGDYSAAAVADDVVIRALNSSAAGNLILTTQSATGSIKFTTGSTVANDNVKAIITNDGNVGLGTTAPGSRISIYGGSSIGASYCTVAAPSNGLIVEGYVGCGTAFPSSSLHLGQVASSAEAATCLLDEKDTTPASPTSGTQVKMYMKADKIIFQYNDGGTVRYKYLDLTGTTDTWTATTTAP